MPKWSGPGIGEEGEETVERRLEDAVGDERGKARRQADLAAEPRLMKE